MSQSGSGSGYKVALLLTRAPAISASAFRERWLNARTPEWSSGISCYLHNSPITAKVPIENAPPAPYDAVDEWVFGSREAAHDWFTSSAFIDGWLAPRKLLIGESAKAIAGHEAQVWQSDSKASIDPIKILTLPVRREGMAIDVFVQHWLVTHAGLALAGPGTRDRLLRLTSTPSDGTLTPWGEPAPFDGIGIIQFDSKASLDAEFASDHYREVMASDEPRFTDPVRSRAMMVAETLVYRAT